MDHAGAGCETLSQGMWMATQEQLKYLMRQCQYLRYTEKSNLPFVEKFSGSLEMFSPECHNTKASEKEECSVRGVRASERGGTQSSGSVVFRV